jgi:integrase/recombinase XerD
MEQITEFLAHIDNEHQITPSTRKAYASDLGKFHQYLQANQKLKQPNKFLTAKTFFRFLEHEKKQGLKPSTLHRRRVTMKKFAEFLFARGELDQNSVAEVASWHQKLWEEISNRDALFLSDSEVSSLYEAIASDEKPRNLRDLSTISLILETGISIGALVNLNLDDTNLLEKKIRVHRDTNHWSRISVAANYLEKYLVVSRPELTQSAKEEALFVSQMGGRITRQGVWQVVKAWGAAAGLDISLSPRILRHTAVRRMIHQKMPLSEIQQLLGHGNKHSTQALIRKILKSKDRGGLNGHERIYHD